MAKKKAVEPKIVRPDDIDPHHRWDRPLQSPGHTQVDFEERVDFRRLHDYRLARTRAALAHSGLGASGGGRSGAVSVGRAGFDLAPELGRRQDLA